MKNILLVGSGAREHAIARAIKRSTQPSSIFCFASNNNPAIKRLCSKFHVGSLKNTQEIVDFAIEQSTAYPFDFAIIGPEQPLADGIVDLLRKINIPAVGPTQKLAQIETSKGFARDLLKNHAGSFLPRYKSFNTISGVKEFLQSLGDNFVIKADGLMSGKGVKVAQEHLFGHEEAISYCQELIEKSCSFLIEEKFFGQEFSLLSFSDGEHLAHMPVVQDHKRAFIDDLGPNTGGMGSYSDANHRLPFLSEHDIHQAQLLNQITIKALAQECKEPYKGVLYGGFMVTASGVKLIEYNARFGDPEVINVLALLKSDFITVCEAIIGGKLDSTKVDFASKATVCKYLVPEGYPDQSQERELIDISAVTDEGCIYYAAVNEVDGHLYTMNSRALAVLGVADNILAAEKIAEETAQKIVGKLFHRYDIGSLGLINKKILQVNQLCNKNYPLIS